MGRARPLPLLGGQALGLGDELVDDGQACVPELGVAEVDADQAAEGLGRLRAARGQQLEVGRDERRALGFVTGVDGEGQEVAEPEPNAARRALLLPVQVRLAYAVGEAERLDAVQLWPPERALTLRSCSRA